ncbi:hypothetical protein PCH70_46710 [Pseudomonas cichorii JBC1]|nr:hypothetical protein PCH70_46710 [Pseudomonas cichorii JBC1]
MADYLRVKMGARYCREEAGKFTSMRRKQQSRIAAALLI